jgi:hypothetical protein
VIRDGNFRGDCRMRTGQYVTTQMMAAVMSAVGVRVGAFQRSRGYLMGMRISIMGVRRQRQHLQRKDQHQQYFQSACQQAYALV